MERTLMETSDAAVAGTCTLRIDRDTIASLCQRLQLGHQFLNAIGYRVELRMANEQSIQRVIPYPLIREEDHIGGEDQLTSQVDMRLVVADHDSGF